MDMNKIMNNGLLLLLLKAEYESKYLKSLQHSHTPAHKEQ